jgi:hypothetical protein
MTRFVAWSFSCGIAIAAIATPKPLYAQLEIGTWVRQSTPSMPGMTMKIEACCGTGGRRLTYALLMDKTKTLLTLESPLDGTPVPVMVNGKPSGETMAIKRVDARHANTVVKMNGKPFGTSMATLSPDGKTLTVLNEYSSSAGGQQAGKVTEVWVKQ